MLGYCISLVLRHFSSSLPPCHQPDPPTQVECITHPSAQETLWKEWMLSWMLSASHVSPVTTVCKTFEPTFPTLKELLHFPKTQQSLFKKVKSNTNTKVFLSGCFQPKHSYRDRKEFSPCQLFQLIVNIVVKRLYMLSSDQEVTGFFVFHHAETSLPLKEDRCTER